jgi:DNA helicase-2/ATP-dependent DNA helicase PcrA
MEDGILPHERSLDHPDALEEERRLVFVGITRGREEVHASCARIRDYRGSRRIAAPSLFLTEMTGSETVVTGAEAPHLDGLAAGGGAFDDEDIAHPGGDDFAQDTPAGRPMATQARDDGLVLEVEDGAAATAPRRPRRAVPALRSAADLAAAVGRLGTPAHSFVAGQRVRHADYGPGTLSKISGVGPRSVGTVIFDGPAGTRTFILGHGALEPE